MSCEGLDATSASETDAFLSEVSGVIHVGAHVGQERGQYARHGLRVLWIEPIPDVFATLQANLHEHPLQSAVQALITDRDDVAYPFHVSGNAGKSSSIFELGLHKQIWPRIRYAKTIVVNSITLDSLLDRNNLCRDDYDALVLDTQGAELLALKGASASLRRFKYIKTEVADFEVYLGCCQLAEVDSYLGEHGFRQRIRHHKCSLPEGNGKCYDIV